jgi:hypothetical protein
MTGRQAAGTGPPGVVVVSGHLVDAPDRPQPRFPPEQVPRVAAEVRAALEKWNAGPGTTLVTGGARGADIIAAEAARARGARIRLVLARRPEEFVKGSVALPGTDWAERFDALLDHADVEIVGGPDDDVYERTNDRILAIARGIDDRPHAIVIWNGQRGDGPGGTSDFVTRLGNTVDHKRLVIIDPNP